jgi:mRNA interferase HicA
MKGNEFIKRVRKLAKTRGVVCLVDEARGKGSHLTLYFGDNLTILRNPKDELKTGTFHAMLKQLGITLDEIMGA